MFTFSQAIVRTPGRSMVSGLTQADLGQPDYELAIAQHRDYVAALAACGLKVLVLDADEGYPDSTFIEDAAVVTPHCAIITRPAAPSRRGETIAVHQLLSSLYPRIETITAPGTLDGGDVMHIGSHFFIGLSGRTNPEGARQFIAILQAYGLTGTTVPVREFLHLKTGVTCIAEGTLLATGECVERPEFSGFTALAVSPEDAGAANCLRINDRILMPAHFPAVRKILADRGEEVIEVDISEFAKLDGGLTCLSLRF